MSGGRCLMWLLATSAAVTLRTVGMPHGVAAQTIGSTATPAPTATPVPVQVVDTSGTPQDDAEAVFGVGVVLVAAVGIATGIALVRR